MRKGFVMLAGAMVALVGLSLMSPDEALARRCGGRHHRRGGCCGTAYYQCGPAMNNCGSGGCGSGGCGTGSYGGVSGYGGAGYGGAAGPGMQGPTMAPNGGMNAPPPPAPAPGA